MGLRVITHDHHHRGPTGATSKAVNRPIMERESRPGGCTDIDWQEYISVDPNICHGRACITGTRVMVTVILDSLAEGLGPEEITAHYPSVSREAVQAALLYAAELARERIVPLGA